MDFAINFLRQVYKDRQTSFISSSTSVASVLAMCMEGARNETASQISKVIGANSNIEKVRDYFTEALKTLNAKDKPYILNSVNKIYVDKKYELLKEYCEILTKFYAGQFQSVDCNDSQGTAEVSLHY